MAAKPIAVGRPGLVVAWVPTGSDGPSRLARQGWRSSSVSLGERGGRLGLAAFARQGLAAAGGVWWCGPRRLAGGGRRGLVVAGEGLAAVAGVVASWRQSANGGGLAELCGLHSFEPELVFES